MCNGLLPVSSITPSVRPAPAARRASAPGRRLDAGDDQRPEPYAVADFAVTGVCRQSDAGGKLIPDAYLAALALEHGCEVVTADKDFRRFPGLRWRHPLN